jgi:hypothetical protein
MATDRPLSFEGVHGFMDTLFGADLHAKRVLSLAGAALGVIESASLAVGLIGQGLALARGRLTKHAVKQVDRLLSDRGIDVDGRWTSYLLSSVGRAIQRLFRRLEWYAFSRSVKPRAFSG